MAGDGGRPLWEKVARVGERYPHLPDLLCDFADWMKLQWGYGM